MCQVGGLAAVALVVLAGFAARPGTHAPDAIFLYDATVPKLHLGPRGYEPEVTIEVTRQLHGRMSGFIVAGFFGALGVGVQLAALVGLLQTTKLGTPPTVVGGLLVAALAGFGSLYVYRTITSRIPVVEDEVPADEVADSSKSLPRRQFVPEGDADVATTAPTTVVSAPAYLDEDSLPPVTGPVEVAVATRPLQIIYPGGGTSRGDEQRRRIAAF